jgi:hypothetical protein
MLKNRHRKLAVDCEVKGLVGGLKMRRTKDGKPYSLPANPHSKIKCANVFSGSTKK